MWRSLRPLLVAASASAVMSAPSSQCSYTYGKAATFDLSPTIRSGEPSYRIVDGDIKCTPKVEENHTYVYNVCADVTAESVPPECWQHGPAGAYRIDASGKCEAIGDSDSLLWQPLDGLDPSKGVQIVMSKQNKGGAYQGPCNGRTLSLVFECYNRATSSPNKGYVATDCADQITVQSWYGCPLECPVSGRELCAGRGHCKYDTGIKRARCFCDMGFEGSGCEEAIAADKPTRVKSHLASSSITVIIIILLVLSVFLAAAMLYMKRQVEALQQDASNYMAFQDKAESSGSETF